MTCDPDFVLMLHLCGDQRHWAGPMLVLRQQGSCRWERSSVSSMQNLSCACGMSRLCCREVALMERQRKEADVKQKQALKGFLG